MTGDFSANASALGYFYQARYALLLLLRSKSDAHISIERLFINGGILLLKLKILPAFEGDCLLITFGESPNITNILIDGGIGRTYVKTLREELHKIIEKKQAVDLLVITHIDDDHIEGIVELFKDSNLDKGIIKKVWFNSERLIAAFEPKINIEPVEIDLGPIESTEMGFGNANKLEAKLVELDCWEQNLIQFKKTAYTLNDAKITVLSPSWEDIASLGRLWERDEQDQREMAARKDYSIPLEELMDTSFVEDNSIINKSSIALLFEYKGKKLLLLGDSHPSDIIRALRELGYSESNKLTVDCVKISHHGSKKNTNNELLSLISCNRFIISTNGSRHGHPNKECLARIIRTSDDVQFLFNYEIFIDIFNNGEMERYNFNCFYVNDLEV